MPMTVPYRFNNNTFFIVLKNPRKPDLSPVEVEALADTGAVHLCIPDHIRIQRFLSGISFLSIPTLNAPGILRSSWPESSEARRNESNSL